MQTEEKLAHGMALGRLRESFVRGRFGEAQVFRNEGIEGWLARTHDPRITGYDLRPWFNPLLYDAFDARWSDRGLVAALERLATPVSDIPDGVFPESNKAELLRKELRPFIAKEIRIFLPALFTGHTDRGPLDFVVILGGEAMVIRYNPGAEIFLFARSATPEYVANAVLREFLSGGPKADLARDELLEAYRNAVKRIRDDAERDFAAAVAVHADGKKVVCADWVAVASSDRREGAYVGSTFTVLDAASFRERKIIFRSEDIIRERANAFASAPSMDEPRQADAKALSHERIRVIADRLTHFYRGLFSRACLVDVKGGGGSRSKILIVDRELCLAGI